MSAGRRAGAAAVREYVVAALPAWAVSRAVVLGALALARYACSDLGAGRCVPGGLLGWDADWYLALARSGYAGVPEEGLRFFPLLPLLARTLAPAGAEGAALLVLANGSALALGAGLFALARAETGDGALARRAAWALALAPPAFVLVMGYAEAPTMALAVGAFAALRTRRWGTAGALGALAGLARPSGALLAVPAAVEAARGWRAAGAGERARRALAVVAPAAGSGAYLAWVGATRGDALLPLRLQQSPALRGPTTDPLTSLGDAAAGLGAGRVGTALHVAWVAALVVLVAVSFRRWPAPYGAYAAASLAVALSASNLDSVERYGLGAFPVVLALASLTASPPAERAAVALSTAGLTAYATLAFLGSYVP